MADGIFLVTRKIAEKNKSFSHQEFNKKEFTDIKKIKEKIISGEDIFDRGFKIKKI